VPIEFRLDGVAAGSIALRVPGVAAKARRAMPLALHGGASVNLYLIILRAWAPVACCRIARVSGWLAGPTPSLSAILSVLQNSLSFSLLRGDRGFLARYAPPRGGIHLVLVQLLLGYYGVVTGPFGTRRSSAIAWFKAWSPLNLADSCLLSVIGTFFASGDAGRGLLDTEPFSLSCLSCSFVPGPVRSGCVNRQICGLCDGTWSSGCPSSIRITDHRCCLPSVLSLASSRSR